MSCQFVFDDTNTRLITGGWSALFSALIAESLNKNYTKIGGNFAHFTVHFTRVFLAKYRRREKKIF